MATETKLRTEPIVVNLGPQHPSTHGVFRMIATLDGETIVGLEPVVGYLHRCHEKLGEKNTYLQNIPYTDRLDYICSMSNNLAYCLAVEKLAGIEVPERAQYIRVIMVELTRLVNHMLAIGALLNDLGCVFTPMLYGLRERERVIDLFEMASGSRMMCNYMRFGGVKADLPPDFLPELVALVRALPAFVDEFERLLTTNEILLVRCVGVGVLTPEMAIAYSCTGPLLRASGVRYDIRRAEPYSIYNRFDFDVPTGRTGDIYDRYLVRIEEMRQSLRILDQAIKAVPGGEVCVKLPRVFKPPQGEAYSRIEAPKGELGFYLVSDGGTNPYRYKIRSPSFINLTVLPEICRGHKVADVVAILGSIDITLGEVDR